MRILNSGIIVFILNESLNILLLGIDHLTLRSIIEHPVFIHQTLSSDTLAEHFQKVFFCNDRNAEFFGCYILIGTGGDVIVDQIIRLL